MDKDWKLTEEAFYEFLSWLDADRERAAEKYERIRTSLIVFFSYRGCVEVEALADKTIDRVIKKVPEIAASYTGNPTHYFVGVANKVYHEYVRTVQTTHRALNEVQSRVGKEDERLVELEQQCLEKCLAELSPYLRDVIMEYYSAERLEKVRHRLRLAEEKGLSPNALRLRMHRVRISLQKCVTSCIEKARDAD